MIRWKGFLWGSKKMLKTNSCWIQKEMVVLRRTSSISFTMRSPLTPLKLKPLKRTPSLDMMRCSQRDLLVMDLYMERRLVGHTPAVPTFTRRKLQKRSQERTHIGRMDNIFGFSCCKIQVTIYINHYENVGLHVTFSSIFRHCFTFIFLQSCEKQSENTTDFSIIKRIQKTMVMGCGQYSKHTLMVMSSWVMRGFPMFSPSTYMTTTTYWMPSR